MQGAIAVDLDQERATPSPDRDCHEGMFDPVLGDWITNAVIVENRLYDESTIQWLFQDAEVRGDNFILDPHTNLHVVMERM